MRPTVSERAAVREGDALHAPTVGTWRPRVALGAPLVAGEILGWLRRDGRWLTVTVPRGAGGAAHEVAKRGEWVHFGARLVTMGEGVLGTAGTQAEVVHGGPEGSQPVSAETDGTVYLRPDPSKPAFVSEGDKVAANTTLALVEVMKTFSPVKAPVAGVVVRIDVEDSASIEEGAPLFWLRPE